ncbi:MAG: hypothetical protein ACR2PL_22680 [Dehalococcoidia bacterium]
MVGRIHKLFASQPKFQVLFHPFRFYVLYQLDQVLEPSVGRMQPLYSAQGYHNLLDRWLASLQQWSVSGDLESALKGWSEIVDLSVVVEPLSFPQLFGHLRVPAPHTEESLLADTDQHRQEVGKCLRGVGIEPIERMRRDLCVDAERLDPNKEVHNVLRLGMGDSRLRIEGKLGGSIYLLTMAEMLRRATEEVFDIELPEEDELGFGWSNREARKMLYGSYRLFDGDRSVANEYLRRHQLDHGLRLRWYVEGNTEYGALESIFHRFGPTGVEVVNLRGRLGKDGQTLRDMLRADLRLGIFSFVSVDADRLDNLRTLRESAKADEICGAFFVTHPDFELGNFDLLELEEMLWEIAGEQGAAPHSRSRLHEAIREVKSGGMLMEKARRALPELSQVAKSGEWGRLLMNFAQQHPDRRNGGTRLIIEAVNMAFRSTVVDYHSIRRLFRVDPVTGRCVERQSDSRGPG